MRLSSFHLLSALPFLPAQSLSTQTPEQVQQVVQTNLLGSLLVTRAAMNRMAGQPGGGHIVSLQHALCGLACPLLSVPTDSRCLCQSVGGVHREDCPAV